MRTSALHRESKGKERKGRVFI